ncbi:hypothetical protein SETIT_1G098700v2 [Setaria italica]|uniref:Uncharacterized protein n=1 Tax=Setaria italica TaxID=4555 RepID=K3YWQ3_SETIT|nr:hypothetical protein SETIT_1G098700v2 [Setaria italica]
MEGKMRAAVLAVCLLVVLLSGQPPRVSGEPPGYDKCYRECYDHCQTTHKPKWACRIRCHSICDRHREVAAAASEFAGDDGACKEICLASVGGSGTTATGGDGLTDADVAACVDGCTGYYRKLNAKHV